MSTHLFASTDFLTSASIGTKVGAVTSWVKIKYEWTSTFGICAVSIADGHNTSDWDVADPLATYPSFANTYYNRGRCQLYLGDETKNVIVGYSEAWGGSIPSWRQVYINDASIGNSSYGTLWPSSGIILFDDAMTEGLYGYGYTTPATRYAYFAAIRTSV